MARKSLIPAGSFLSEGDAEGPNDTGLLGRIVKNDAVKHGRRSEIEVESGAREEPSQYDKSYDNMTSHTESHTEDNTPGNTDSRKASNTAVRAVRQKPDPTPVLPAGQTSLRSAIQATIQQTGQTGEVLKTVTIKLAPSLDRRVEEHCFQTGRKKQDVVRDGLLLYFEAIEDAAEGEGE